MAASVAAILTQGCASSPAPPPVVPSAPPPACTAGASVAAPDSIAVALPWDVAPSHAPDPQNLAERLVFAQLYESLLRVDCNGRLESGLARVWTFDETTRRWTVVLRDNARFWDGEPLAAWGVVAAWRTTGQSSSPRANLARRLVDATTVVDDRTLVISLADSSPNVLAEPSLAVYRPRPGAAWPEGTGSYSVTGERLELLPVAPGTGPHVAVRLIRDADARDQLDAGVDMLLSDDPRIVGYAASRPDVISLPLPWDRVYVLASPRRGGEGKRAIGKPLGGESDLRAALARDVVRVEARAPDPPFWWSDAARCERQSTTPAPSPATGTTRIVYRRGDRVAQQLAERLAALAAIDAGRTADGRAPLALLSPELVAAGSRTTVAALAPADFAIALQAGTELAYVLDVPRRSLTVCDDAQALLASAPWLAGSDTALALGALVETRARALVRRDRVALVVDGDGTLRFIASARRAASGTQ